MTRLNKFACIVGLALVFAVPIQSVEAGSGPGVPWIAFGWNNTYSNPLAGGDGSTDGLAWANLLGLNRTGGAVVTNVPDPDNPFFLEWNSTEDFVSRGFLGTISFSGAGTVNLVPLNEDLTEFTATWEGELIVTGGTGLYHFVGPADEPIQLTATNSPFSLADEQWFFNWFGIGRIRLFDF